MSKKRKPHTRSQTPMAESELKPQAPSKGDLRETTRSRNLPLVLDVVAIALSIFGMLLWIPSFRPLIQIANNNYFDPHDPFSAPFSVSNNGLFPVYNVQFSCILFEMISSRGLIITGANIRHKLPAASVLRRGDKLDILCPLTQFAVGITPITKADIDVIVTFTAPLIRLQSCARFTTFSTPDGSLHWMQSPETDMSRCRSEHTFDVTISP